jgi:Mg2+-importing ATPase
MTFVPVPGAGGGTAWALADEIEVPVTVAAASSRDSAAVPSPVRAVDAAALSSADVLARLGSGTSGLSEDDAERRLSVVGPNAVRSHRARTRPVLMGQLRSPLLWLLAATAIVSAFLGQGSDAVIIGVILLASVGLGFVNEYKAARPPRRCIPASITAAWCCATGIRARWM